jgi:Domain of unknown function (DUF4399)
MRRMIAISLGLMLSALGSTAFAQNAAPPLTPSPTGARVFFVEPTEGATVGKTFKVRFGLAGMQIAPAGSNVPNSGHHHLYIDAEPPLDGERIPSDFNHLHYGAGQTEAEVTLPVGDHTLQLVLGDANHVPHVPPVISGELHIHVVDKEAAPAVAAEPPPKAVAQRPGTGGCPGLFHQPPGRRSNPAA